MWTVMVDYREDMRFSNEMMKRVAEAYRKVRNTIRYLLSNLYDFDPARDAVAECALDDLDRYALHRHRQVVARVLQAYETYEFHLVYHQLVQYAAADLSSFYLDVLKDRLYTTAPRSLARRSAQTALWQITHAMLRWMAPFLSFTAEEAWAVFDGAGGSIFTQTYWRFDRPDEPLLKKWSRIREIREAANKAIEDLRTQGQVGSSLQATLAIRAPASDHALLASLGDALKFVFITSAASLAEGDALQIEVRPSTAAKCDRCWHYRDDVGADTAHPTICGRCASNLFGAGEARPIA
jgi:isoleucyl-tRNA synthetase